MLRIRSDVLSDPLEGVDADNPDSENLWKNAELYRYMNEAHHAVARRTEMLKHYFTLPVVEGEAFVSLPRWVINLRAVRLAGAKRQLDERNFNEFLNDGGGTDDYGNSLGGRDFFESQGTPDFYSRDVKANTLRLSPIPAADDTLDVYATVLPRYDIEAPTDVIVFTEPQDHAMMLNYMAMLAYRKNDADTYNPRQAVNFEGLFESAVAERIGDVSRRHRRPGTVRYGGL